MFKDACKGVKETNLYDGPKEKCNDFVKLLNQLISNVRVIEVLKIQQDGTKIIA